MSAAPEAAHRVRRLTLADLPQVLEIERTAYQFPWSEGIFRDCLRVGYHCFVATDLTDRVLGFALVSIAAGEAHVLNLCVHPQRRRNGVASLLLEHMLDAAARSRADNLLLEVRPSNTAALALYAAHGFERVGLRKRYYPAATGREDAILLEKQIG